MTIQIIAHGGANNITKEAEKRMHIIQKIVDDVSSSLNGDESAVDICEAVIIQLEDNPVFNAGTGSYLQVDGQVRMDAAIMSSHLDLGCVLQISDVKNPISVARKLYDSEMHTVLSGLGARAFAEECGFERHDLQTHKKERDHKHIIEPLDGDLSYSNVESFYVGENGDSLGTVGCVVRDNEGIIAAGTSTGGRRVCFQGRVSDSGLPGNGTYANRFAGVSCTGVGEKIMRVGMARMVAAYVEAGDALATACDKVMDQLKSIYGSGGLIAISASGEIVSRLNTKHMSVGIFKG